MHIINCKYVIAVLFCIVISMLFSCNKENQPPNCRLTVPADNSEFFIGEFVYVSVDADDPDGNVTKVEFYADSIRWHTSFSYPYSILWTTNGVPPGSYILRVVAFDDQNLTTSDEINIVLFD